jgi:hypothetical protein
MTSTLRFPLPLIPTLLGSSFIALGLFRLLSPRDAYRLFGLPLPSSPSLKSDSDPSPFIYANGRRDLTIRLAYFIFAAQRNREAVRALTLACIVRADKFVPSFFVRSLNQSKNSHPFLFVTQ